MQAKVSFAPIAAYDFGDALAVIADPHPKFPVVITDFHLDALRIGVSEGVAQPLSSYPVDFVTHDGMQGARRAFDLHREIRPAAVRRCKFFTKGSNRQCQIVTLHRRRAQPFHRIPPLDNRLLRLINNAFESLFALTHWKLVGDGLKMQQDSMKTL